MGEGKGVTHIQTARKLLLIFAWVQGVIELCWGLCLQVAPAPCRDAKNAESSISKVTRHSSHSWPMHWCRIRIAGSAMDARRGTHALRWPHRMSDTQCFFSTSFLKCIFRSLHHFRQSTSQMRSLTYFSKNITPASDPKQCVGGQQQKILYVSLRQPPNTRRRDKSQENCLQDICLCLLYTSYLKILCRSHVSDLCRSVHQWGAATRSTSSDSCLNIFVSQAPLQDPCLWTHVSASMCISGSSARSMLPDS